MIHKLISIILGFISYIIFPIHIACNLILLGLGVNGSCNEDDVEKYYSFKKNVSKGVIIFNHPTFFDHVVIMKELKDTPRFAMYDKYIVGPVKWLCNRLNVLPISSSQGNTCRIRSAIKTRKNNESLLAVSPSAGKCHVHDIAALAKFRTGAFVEMPDVLPIIINYEPYEPWMQNTSLLKTMIRRLRGCNVSYQLKVLDPVSPLQDETPNRFAARCRTIMRDALKHPRSIDSPPPNGSPLCLMTSLLFLFCAITTLKKGAHYIPFAMGMLMVFITSIFYHGTGDNDLRLLDIISNVYWGIFFSIPLIATKQWIPMLCLLVAICSYIFKLNHASFVHIPIAIGFLNIKLF